MPEKRPSEYRAQWDALTQEAALLVAEAKALRGLPALHQRVQAQEAALAALDVSKDAVAHGVWLATAQDLGDLLLLAEISWEYAWGLAGTAPFPTLPDGIDDREQEEVAVAYLIRGVVAVAAAASLPPPRREPAAALVAEIARMVASVHEDEAAIGVLSTGEAIAVALVLNRADLLPHGGYTWIDAVDRLGPEWCAAAHAVQRQRGT